MKTSKNCKYVAKPIIKWAGGKTQLLPTISQYYPCGLGTENRKYIEPFFGGGAVFFDLYNKALIDSAIIVDNNPELFILYKTIQEYPDKIIDILSHFESTYSSLNHQKRATYFYAFRDNFNKNRKNNYEKSNPKRAAQIIFLNRTCFNGLFRVNSKQEFNVPHGHYKNPKILDIINIYAVSRALQIAEIIHNDFTCVENMATADHFIYYDPPYKPISQTSNFTAYSGLFDDSHQIRLSETFKRLDANGTRQMLSNSDPLTMFQDNFFDSIYSGFYIHRLMAKRRINSNATRRGSVSELLITNYQHQNEQ